MVSAAALALTLAATFDPKPLLEEPGVRLVAVELYASWCKPCVEAVPRWQALARRYRDAGLRVVVVVTEDPEGCESPPWPADEVICDRDGTVARALGAGQRLPASFLYSWRNDTLVGAGPIDAVEAAVARFVEATPRVHVQAGTVETASPEALVGLVRGELSRSTKMMVVASPEERARLDALLAESLRARYDESLECEMGLGLSANALLEVWLTSRGTSAPTLQLQLFSAERGCLVSSGIAPWRPDAPEVSVRSAVRALDGTARGASPISSPRTALIQTTPEDEELRPLPPVLTGIGITAVTLGIVFGVQAARTVDETRATPHRDAADRLDRAQTLAGAADVLALSGVVLTGVGLYLWMDP